MTILKTISAWGQAIEKARVTKDSTDTATVIDNAGKVVSGAGGGATDIPFSLAIPLTSGGSAYMPQQNVTGAMNFTVMANAVRNSLVYLRLVANGTNTPTFTGFKEWGGSLGFDNRNGIVNQLQFFNDGYDTYYTASQVVGAVAIDITPPTQTSASVANASPTVVALVMNEALATGSVPAASAFTVSGHTVSSVAISGSTVNVTVTPAFANGEAARTLAYTQPGTNGLRDATGNLVVSFTGLAITNNVAAVDVTAPVIQSAAMNGTSLVMTYNEALTANSPTLTALGLVVDGGAAVNPTAAVASGTTVTLTFGTAVTAGQVLSLSYTAGAVAIKDAIGNNAANLSAYAVTNNTGAVSSERLINTRLLTEGGSPGAYTYSGTGGAFNAATNTDGAGVLNLAFQSGVDGWASLVSTVTPVVSSGPEIVFGVDVSAANNTYAGLDYCTVNHPAGYAMFVNSTGGPADATVQGAAGDMIRIKRTGSTLVFDVSKNGGTSWTVIKTYTGVSTGVLYVHVKFAYASAISSLASSGLV